MPRKKSSHDREVLLLKLQAVERFVATYEQRIEYIRAQVLTAEANMREPGNAPRLLRVLRKAMVPASLTAVPTSLINSDLRTEEQLLGPSHATRITKLRRTIAADSQSCLALQTRQPTDKSFVTAALRLAGSIVHLFEAALEPAQALRAKLMRDLDIRAAADAPTDGQRARKRRNERIQELARDHRKPSPAKLLAICKGDDELTQLKPLARVTKDIVRDVLRLAQHRGKKRG